ncbi:uroporphyrinogen-III synthase [Acetobacter sp. AN02]|uniref:uroporphyrinogen-III synthase n=1 Tax=Acetobacter sp. AN02 TaxID=2894186 RepID=UPI0024346615|nr:uroporphyrinogen-III synthase [Acetobacter sp. AN02]MDG6094739.1 uroporphyrinogen-III synthase [Acetobacter sp. AN02]
MTGAVRPGVLITRPEPGLSATAEAVRALGWNPVAAPALIIRPATLSGITRRFQAVLITSGQSLPALRVLDCPDIPLFTVGDATAERARAAGFTQVRSASGDADSLATLIRHSLDPESGSLLLLSGAGQGTDLATRLRHDGFRIIRRVAYRTLPETTPPPEALQVLQNGALTAVMVFSSASARATILMLQNHAPQLLPCLRGIAISARAGNILAAAGLPDVRAASRPDTPSMLKELGQATDISGI